jgi:L-iditol 2-dehydrogenase
MRGVVKYKRGEGNMEIQEVPEPRPDPNEVKIEVKAAGICGSDIHIYHDDIKIPIKTPVVVGHEFSGIIAELGENVKHLKVGERVTSETAASVCGLCQYCRTGHYNLCSSRLGIGYWINGAFTKYCVVPQERVHPLPGNVDFISGALCEPLACCVHGVIELTNIHAGDWVAITGPGPIGLLSLQIAKAEGGKTIVLGVSKDAERLTLAKNLGADRVMNIQKEDPLEIMMGLTGDTGADVVLECSGVPSAAEMGLTLVKKMGRYTQIGLFGRPIEIDFEKIAYKELKVAGTFSQKWTAWKKALDLLAQGKINVRPLVSHILPISDWKQGFKIQEEKGGMKVVLTPEN